MCTSRVSRMRTRWRRTSRRRRAVIGTPSCTGRSRMPATRRIGSGRWGRIRSSRRWRARRDRRGGGTRSLSLKCAKRRGGGPDRNWRIGRGVSSAWSGSVFSIIARGRRGDRGVQYRFGHAAGARYNQAMIRQLEVVYESGVLRPLEPLPFAEQQHLVVTVTDELRSALPFSSRKREQEWFRLNGPRYAGKWVAIEGDRLVSHGENARAVLQQARAEGVQHP